jgi:hypothetical protein
MTAAARDSCDVPAGPGSWGGPHELTPPTVLHGPSSCQFCRLMACRWVAEQAAADPVMTASQLLRMLPADGTVVRAGEVLAARVGTGLDAAKRAGLDRESARLYDAFGVRVVFVEAHEFAVITEEQAARQAGGTR